MRVFTVSEEENSPSPLGVKMQITLAHSHNQGCHEKVSSVIWEQYQLIINI